MSNEQLFFWYTPIRRPCTPIRSIVSLDTKSVEGECERTSSGRLHIIKENQLFTGQERASYV